MKYSNFICLFSKWRSLFSQKLKKKNTILGIKCESLWQASGAQLDILLKGGKGEKIFLPALNILGGGKCVLYSNNKKLTLPTGYSVSQHIWYEIKYEL